MHKTKVMTHQTKATAMCCHHKRVRSGSFCLTFNKTAQFLHPVGWVKHHMNQYFVCVWCSPPCCLLSLSSLYSMCSSLCSEGQSVPCPSQRAYHNCAELFHGCFSGCTQLTRPEWTNLECLLRRRRMRKGSMPWKRSQRKTNNIGVFSLICDELGPICIKHLWMTCHSLFANQMVVCIQVALFFFVSVCARATFSAQLLFQNLHFVRCSW